MYEGTKSLTCDIIFLFLILILFLSDLSIRQAKPKTFAFDFFTIFAHSKLDLPVVITSSTIKTFAFFLIANPLLNFNFLLILSQKIVSLFNNLPIS